MPYPGRRAATLAAGIAAISGCAAASASQPRFPDPLPPHTKIAYAHSYGGFAGGHAYVIVTSEGKARVKCRFADKPLRRRVKPSKWDGVLGRAHLSKVKSDDPDSPPVESPEIWIFYEGRVTYLQAFSHRGGYPARVTAVQRAFERYLSNTC